MSGPRFYLLAASFAAMLAFTMIATGGEAVVSAAPQAPSLPPNHPAITTPAPAREGISIGRAGGVAADQAPSPGRAGAAPQAPAGDYVGEDTCMGCHDDKSYKG